MLVGRMERERVLSCWKGSVGVMRIACECVVVEVRYVAG